MMDRHADWNTAAFGLRPVAPDTGPFPGRGFLEALWNHTPTGDLYLAETASALVPLSQSEAGLQWIGHPDLVDYRSPLGDGAVDLIAEVVTESPAGLPYRFDSLPVEGAEVVRRGLAKAGLSPRSEQHAVTARVQLPDTYEEYLARVGKKERHEIRRKQRRFRDEYGSPVLITTRGAGEGFDRFVEMHRSSSGTKGRFMTSEMEGLFASLAGQDGWRIDLLCSEGGEPVAATIGWADTDGFYLYNSAFDRKATGSPGIVLLTMMIEQAIEANRRVFDFLKGDEPYKFRLGATPRPLFRFEGLT